jgi:hypothetical protein
MRLAAPEKRGSAAGNERIGLTAIGSHARNPMVPRFPFDEAPVPAGRRDRASDGVPGP